MFRLTVRSTMWVGTRSESDDQNSLKNCLFHCAPGHIAPGRIPRSSSPTPVVELPEHKSGTGGAFTSLLPWGDAMHSFTLLTVFLCGLWAVTLLYGEMVAYWAAFWTCSWPQPRLSSSFSVSVSSLFPPSFFLSSSLIRSVAGLFAGPHVFVFSCSWNPFGFKSSLLDHLDLFSILIFSCGKNQFWISRAIQIERTSLTRWWIHVFLVLEFIRLQKVISWVFMICYHYWISKFAQVTCFTHPRIYGFSTFTVSPMLILWFTCMLRSTWNLFLDVSSNLKGI